ncbi:MAG: UDP-N-acetylglucosamine--N-acetylmuramyl-(pentapeptide) pyrophosphoryl-undecaprenol N-acetylglucosamine transferase [Nitrospira sp.]|nr:UDP-N-acetylglucosamine--N-acetylmuramyl-(pentapeptide) pyrophosphoryl-undecaprenol N-acetylglucosamine transferase [Nitrospira sp.]
MTDNLNVILSSGETYGHLNLAVALIECIKEHTRQSKIVFVGVNGRVQMERVLPADILKYSLTIVPVERKNRYKNLMLPFYFGLSLIQSMKILQQHRPDVVVGLGAYPSGPFVYAAALKKIPTIIIEPNVYPGKTNTFLKNKADKICISFSETAMHFPKEKLVLTGTPIRNSIIYPSVDRDSAYRFFGLSPNLRTCLVTGGSSDSGALNRVILDNVSLFAGNNIQLLWQTGERDFAYVSDRLKNKNLHHFRVLPFIEQMEQAYAIADLAVSAGGAVTLAELSVSGVPSIILPSSTVTENHHMYNARAYSQKGACIIIEPHDIAKKLPEAIINTITNEQNLKVMQKQIRKFAKPEASKLIFDEIMKCVLK